MNVFISDTIQRIWTPHIVDHPRPVAPTYGRVNPYPQPERTLETDSIYQEIKSIDTPSRYVPSNTEGKTNFTPHKAQKSGENIQLKTSGSTIALIVSLGILFLAVNIGICAILYLRKRKHNVRENAALTSQQTRAEFGEVDVIGQKSLKEDKKALKTLKNSCSVIKSISLNKMRSSSHKNKKKQESCKTPKSDDSGGFRERFQLRRHLSTSTLDAHTKVRDWIATHRCSPNIMRKSNTQLDEKKHINVIKPFTRSEEILSDSKTYKTQALKIQDEFLLKEPKCNDSSNTKIKTSNKNNSNSVLSSQSSISSQKKSLNSSIKDAEKSTDSLRSRETESLKSKKVSVAIDATPSARTNSILQQEPIELTKPFDEEKHSKNCNEPNENDIKGLNEKDTEKLFSNEVTLCLTNENKPLKISHQHSISDPVADINYDDIFKNKVRNKKPDEDILPPVTFRNDINVTSRDENITNVPLNASDALLTIKKRNFPKVLPDLPQSQKRLSLQPTAFQTFRNFSGSIESESDYVRIPPTPPPRTTTLDRRLAYKQTTPLSSFESTEATTTLDSGHSPLNYENIELFQPGCSEQKFNTFKHAEIPVFSHKRDYPKVIIASSNILNAMEPKLLFQTSPSQICSTSNVPRVRLPDDFHSHVKDSVGSFSSLCCDDDSDILEYDLNEDVEEDKLIQELVGGVESPTKTEDTLDSKGPATIFEKKLEIIPVKVNAGYVTPRTKEDYVCITDLHLPDASDFERTANIKPNYGINKLQQRSESIHRPPEKAVKVVQRGFMKPSAIIHRGIKNVKKNNERLKSDSSKLEHSNSGSSNDTETSTGTVKQLK